MDYIQGEKFRLLADYTYAPDVLSKDDYDKVRNTLDISTVKPGSIIYTPTIYLRQLFAKIHDLPYDLKLKVICHNSDVPITPDYVLPACVKRLYATNVAKVDGRIQSIPIGLENNRWFISTKKKEKIREIVHLPQTKKNVLYINHNVGTNPAKRLKPYELFKDKPWATIEHGENGQNFDNYLHNVYSHQFVLCPEGNGIDTHRTWESLYVGTIPIEVRNINNQYYTDLPICFVDSWEEITPSFLLREYERIQHQSWNMEKLSFTHWKNLIIND